MLGEEKRRDHGGTAGFVYVREMRNWRRLRVQCCPGGARALEEQITSEGAQSDASVPSPATRHRGSEV